MRFDLLPTLALAFYCVTLAAQRIVLNRRRVRTEVDWDRGSYGLYDVIGVTFVPAGVALGFTDYGRLSAGGSYVAAAGLLILVAGTALRWAAIVTLWQFFTPNVSILIRVEEEALLEHFGAEYAAYAGETKRLVPGIY